MTPEIIKIDTNTEIEVTRYGGGNLKSKIPYVNGEKHGVEERRNEDGTKWYEEMWKEGESHGLRTGWGYNGEKWWEEWWRADKLHGVATWWDENGAKSREMYYIEGKRYGVIKWDEKGSVTEVKLPTTPTTPNRKPIVKTKKSHQEHDKLVYI